MPGPDKSRTARITVVLVDGEAPVSIRVTPHQRAEIERHARRAPSLSAWVRETLDAARGRRAHAMAADDAGLDLVTWVRVLVLARARETDLDRQIMDARDPAGAGWPTTTAGSGG